MMISITSMVSSQQVGTGISFYRKISKASDTAYSIEFTKKALDPNSEEYQSLCKSVRKVLGIIVGLLKDRACAEEEPERKRVRIEGKRSKNN
jgi:hypothetical protein